MPLFRKRHARPLTPGETAMARLVFGDAIDYPKVAVHACAYLPFGLQPRRTAMAPNGHLYFPRACFQDDFSVCDLGNRMWFIHEMTHVWQTQARGRFYLPLMRHPFCRYSYELTPGKPFDRYGLEQQAEIVTHVFLAGRGVRLAQVPPKELLPFAIV